MRVKGILFDLDDTMIERRDMFPKYATYFLKTFEERLQTIEPDKLAELIQVADAGGYRKEEEKYEEMLDVLPWLTKPTMVELFEHWNQYTPISSVPRTGIWSMLEELKSREIRMGIITNGRTDRQHAKINELKFSRFFDSIIVSDEVGLRKPDPRIFQLALQELGLTPEETWYVGDHPVNDIIGAEGAGLTAVWRRGCHPWPQAHPEPKLQFDTLDEIIPLLERFEAEGK